MKFTEVKSALAESGKMIIGAGFVLIFTVPMVRIYINSGINEMGISSMPIAMAEWVALLMLVKSGLSSLLQSEPLGPLLQVAIRSVI